MKLPEFNHAKMQWDSWNAFHIPHKYGVFVQFDTGEFVVCSHRWSPDDRRVYPDLNLQVVATDDDACPKLYTPGMASVVGALPIPKSHLNHNGQQTLLLDLGSKRAVSLDRWLTRDNSPSVPERFTKYNRICAYYAGPDAVPVAAPIVRHYPTPLTYDERQHIKELENASKVWLQMQSDPDAITREQRKLREATLKVAEFVNVSFAMLTVEHRCAIALHGFDMIKKEVHPWLTFNIETSDETITLKV